MNETSARRFIWILVLLLVDFAYGQSRDTQPCGGELENNDYNLLKNPGYPRNGNPQGTYPPSTDCEWYYHGDQDTLIVFKFWDMVIEIGEDNSNITCDYDFVNVSITSIESRKYCGYAVPPDTIIGLGSLFVHFHSDNSVNYRGFQASYTITPGFNPCEPSPCNDGECGRTEDRLRSKCDCNPGSTGERCNADIKECVSGPCQNGATCDDSSVKNKYICECPRRWQGVNCEQEKDPPCTSSPCQNDGTCSLVGDFDFACDCPPYYKGNLCEIETGCRNPGISYLEERKRFEEGTTIEFSCKEGFILTGPVNLTCYEDGTWSHIMPECINNSTTTEDNAISSWLGTMIGLGVTLAVNLVVFTLWMVYRGPWVKLNTTKTISISYIRNNTQSICSSVSDEVFEEDRQNQCYNEHVP